MKNPVSIMPGAYAGAVVNASVIGDTGAVHWTW